MLPDRGLDFGIGFRIPVLQLPPLVDVPLDEDRQHRGADHPVIRAARLVEELPIPIRGREQLDVVEIGALEPAALHHPQEQLRMGRRPADAAGLLLVDVGGQHRARVLRRIRMTHHAREELGEVPHVHGPFLLEVRQQALQRHAALRKPRPRPVVLPFDHAEEPFLQHGCTVPASTVDAKKVA